VVQRAAWHPRLTKRGKHKEEGKKFRVENEKTSKDRGERPKTIKTEGAPRKLDRPRQTAFSATAGRGGKREGAREIHKSEEGRHRPRGEHGTGINEAGIRGGGATVKPKRKRLEIGKSKNAEPISVFQKGQQLIGNEERACLTTRKRGHRKSRKKKKSWETGEPMISCTTGGRGQ